VNKRKTLVLLAALSCILLTGKVLAMDSTNYRLDWFTPLTGGGGAADSTNYAISFTVGQTVAGASDSTGYESCLGYWCEGGGVTDYNIFLPLVLRNS
jgi:hypothetical protein